MLAGSKLEPSPDWLYTKNLPNLVTFQVARLEPSAPRSMCYARPVFREVSHEQNICGLNITPNVGGVGTYVGFHDLLWQLMIEF